MESLRRLCLFCLWLPVCIANENLTTVLVCEGGLASLHCAPGHQISVHLANFGRFSLQTCNPTMRLDINTQCHNAHTIDVLRARCEHRQRCVVPVNWATFPAAGDQCPETPKYLDALYGCVRATTTTTTTTLSTSVSTQAHTTQAGPFEREGHVPFDGGGTGKGATDRSPVTGCPPHVTRHLDWPLTPFGRTARVGCPSGSRGHAEWHCSAASGRWSPEEGPDLGGCTSDWARELREDVEEETGRLESSREKRTVWLDTLREVHSHVRREELTGGDVRLVAELLADLVRGVLGRRRQTPLEMLDADGGGAKQQQENSEFARLVIDTLGHLLRANQRQSWRDLGVEQRRSVAVQLLHTLPRTLGLLLPLPSWPKSGSESLLAEPTLVAEVAQASIYDYVPFPSMSLYRQNFDTALLPREALQFYGQDLANVFYIAWDAHMGDYLLGNSSARDGRRTVSKLVGVYVVPPNGKVVGPRQQRIASNRPVVLTFHNEWHEKGKMAGQPRCAWWDPERQQFVDSERQGCVLRGHNQSHTVCECPRMGTHFAVLADFEADAVVVSDWASQALFRSVPLLAQLCTLGSTALFALALAVSLLFGRPMREAAALHQAGRTGRRHSRVHICAVLLLVQLVLAARHLFQVSDMLCIVSALSLHYLVLCALCWTLLDAAQMRTSAAGLRPRDSQPNKHSSAQPRLCLIAYGLPLPFVGVSFPFVGHSVESCWPAPGSAAVLCTLLAPCSLLLLCSMGCLASTLRSLCSSTKTMQMKGPSNSYLACSTGSAVSSKSAFSPLSGQKAERRPLLQLRRRLKWFCARLALLCATFSAAVCSALLGTGSGGLLDGALALLLLALGVQMLAEVLTDKKTRVAYRRWHEANASSALSTLLRPVDVLCCCTSGKGGNSAQQTTSGGAADFPQLKFCDHNGRSTSTSSCGGNGAGPMSACSEVSTTELPMSSCSAGSLPPPAPLLQLYQEHQRRNEGNPSAQLEPEMDSDNGGCDYATIPYEELGGNGVLVQYPHYHYHHRKPQHYRHSPMLVCGGANSSSSLARPIATPRLSQQQLYGLYSARGPSLHPNGLYSPRLLHNSGVLLYSPQLVRVHRNGDAGHQVQLVMRPSLAGEGAAAPNCCATEMEPPHSAPPNFPPPPPPAPGADLFPNSGFDPEVHFRRPGAHFGGGTLLLRMDLSRPEPVFSECILRDAETEGAAPE